MAEIEQNITNPQYKFRKQDPCLCGTCDVVQPNQVCWTLEKMSYNPTNFVGLLKSTTQPSLLNS